MAEAKKSGARGRIVAFVGIPTESKDEKHEPAKKLSEKEDKKDKKEYFEGVPERQCVWTHHNWVLHAALSMIGNEKPRNASIDVISIDFFNMRHTQRSLRFIQAALHKEKNDGKEDEIILLWKNARAQCKRLSPKNILSRLILLQANSGLASSIHSENPETFRRLSKETENILKILEKTPFSPEKIRVVQIESDQLFKLIDGIARGFNRLGSTHEKLCIYNDALNFKRKSLAIFENVHRGNIHVNIAALSSNVGLIFETVGKRSTAIVYKVRGLDMLEILTDGRDDERVATSMNNLGVSVQDTGQRHLGTRLQKLALEMRIRLFSPNLSRDHEKVATSLNNLGAALDTSNNRSLAFPLLRLGLAMNERLYPSGHKNLAMNLSNLGAALMHLGNDASLKEGLIHLQRGVEMFKALKEKHEADGEDVAISLNNLGIVKEIMKDDAGAKLAMKEAYEIRQNLWQTRDIATLASSMVYFGRFQIRSAIPEEKSNGEKLLRDGIDMFERIGIYSMDIFIGYIALFPIDNYEVNVERATRLLPHVKKLIKTIPSFYVQQICDSFANVLKHSSKSEADELLVNGQNALASHQEELQSINKYSCYSIMEIISFIKTDKEVEEHIEQQENKVEYSYNPDAYSFIENARLAHFPTKQNPLKDEQPQPGGKKITRFIAPVPGIETTKTEKLEDLSESDSTVDSRENRFDKEIEMIPRVFENEDWEEVSDVSTVDITHASQLKEDELPTVNNEPINDVADETTSASSDDNDSSSIEDSSTGNEPHNSVSIYVDSNRVVKNEPILNSEEMWSNFSWPSMKELTDYGRAQLKTENPEVVMAVIHNYSKTLSRKLDELTEKISSQSISHLQEREASQPVETNRFLEEID
jgi:tetratricopeptide (TPR) repeat protein